MNLSITKFIFLKIATCIGVTFIFGCGGGSTSSEVTRGTDLPLIAGISGSVVKGPVSNAQVCAYELTGSGKGRLIACTTSNSSGNYAFSVSYTGDVVIEVSGGSYIDETTNANTSLTTTLTSVGSVKLGVTSQVIVTPLTQIVYRSALLGTLTTQNFFISSSTVRSVFDLPHDFDLSSEQPILSHGSENAYGAALRLVSQSIAQGATLEGLINNFGFTVVNEGFQRSKWCQPDSEGYLKNWNVLLLAKVLNGAQSNRQPLVIEVSEPSTVWRSEVATSSTYRRCNVISSTSTKVELSCPIEILQGVAPNTYTSPNSYSNLKIYAANSSQTYTTPSVFNPNDLIVAGGKIKITGGSLWLSYGGNVSVYASGGIAQIAEVVTTGTRSISAKHAIDKNVNDACRLSANGFPAAGSASLNGTVVWDSVILTGQP